MPHMPAVDAVTPSEGDLLEAEIDALDVRIDALEAAGGATGAAGGNLGGTYPNPTVDGITLGSDAQGDVYYRGASGLARLPAGTSGYVLTTAGASANPSWQAASGGGGSAFEIDVTASPFNAAGDGVTDDTAAIQAALDAAELLRTTAHTGVTVNFPAGVYIVNRVGVEGHCLHWPYTAPAVTSVGILASVPGLAKTITLATPADADRVEVGDWITFYDNDGGGGGPGTKRQATQDYDARYVEAINHVTGVITLSQWAVGTKAELSLAGRTYASSVLTLTGNAADGETVTIGSKVYTWQTVLTNVDGNVFIGASASASLDNLIDAINLGSGAGTDYAAAMTLHPTVTAFAGAGDTMKIVANTIGTGGNSIATTDTMGAEGTWTSTVMSNCSMQVKAAPGGTIGNTITLAFVADGTGNGELDESAVPTLVWHFEAGVTTHGNFDNAVNNSTYLETLVEDATSTGNTFVTGDAFAAVALSGGSGCDAGDHIVLDPGSRNITLRGEGTSTVLKLGAVGTVSDLYLLLVDRHAENGLICDMVFDGAFPINTSTSGLTEQNHGIRFGRGSGGTGVGGGCHMFRVDRVLFRDWRGDGIQILGSISEPVTHLAITNCFFDACHRSGVGVNRCVYDTSILHSHFRRTNDQDIDFEPSSNRGEIRNFLIGFNHIDHSNRHGNIALTLTGVGGEEGRRNIRCRVIGNMIIDGHVSALNAEGLDFSHNHMWMRGADQNDPMIKLYRAVQSCRITNNTFYRGYEIGADDLTTAAGHCINIIFNDDRSPSDIEISGNVIDQYSPASSIVVDGVNNVRICNNTVRYHANSGSGIQAIRVEANDDDISGVDVSHNTVVGDFGSAPLNTGIRIGDGTNFTDKALLAFNKVTGCSAHDLQLNGTNFTSPPCIIANLLSRNISNSGAATICVGGTGTRLHLEGTGTPDSLSLNIGLGSQFTDIATGFFYMQTDVAGLGADWTQL